MFWFKKKKEDNEYIKINTLENFNAEINYRNETIKMLKKELLKQKGIADLYTSANHNMCRDLCNERFNLSQMREKYSRIETELRFSTFKAGKKTVLPFTKTKEYKEKKL